MENKPLFEGRNLQYVYNGKTVLDIPGLEFYPGRITVISGDNGSGKTTLLRLLNGLIFSAKTELFFGGSRADAALIREKSVMVHQDPFLFSGTVEHNICWALKTRKLPEAEIQARLNSSLSEVGLEGFRRRRVRELSGGEKQRVAVARALALDTQLILLDEPVANIDRASVIRIEEVLERLKKQRKAIIITSHNQHFAYRICDDMIMLDSGRKSSLTENIYEGGIAGSEEGLSHFKTAAGAFIFCPAAEGSYRKAVISRNDVLISLEPVKSSAHNSFLLEVSAVEPAGPVFEVSCTGELAVKSSVTADTVNRLGLSPGRKVWCTFKAAAVKLY
jgi:tungstate transport system ATP-binding protein